MLDMLSNCVCWCDVCLMTWIVSTLCILMRVACDVLQLLVVVCLHVVGLFSYVGCVPWCGAWRFLRWSAFCSVFERMFFALVQMWCLCWFCVAFSKLCVCGCCSGLLMNGLWNACLLLHVCYRLCVLSCLCVLRLFDVFGVRFVMCSYEFQPRFVNPSGNVSDILTFALSSICRQSWLATWPQDTLARQNEYNEISIFKFEYHLHAC